MKTKEQLDAEAAALLEMLRAKGALAAKDRAAIPQQDMPSQTPEARVRNTREVAEGYTEAMARVESMRCLQCPTKPCVAGCPVEIDIPGFVKAIAEGRDGDAIAIIKRTSLLPSVCGRVCPQETQCMEKCTLGKIRKDMQQSVAIGRLERYAADLEREAGRALPPPVKPATGRKVAANWNCACSTGPADNPRRRSWAIRPPYRPRRRSYRRRPRCRAVAPPAATARLLPCLP